jgi:Holliday junction resolvase RusA-like endonuclease
MTTLPLLDDPVTVRTTSTTAPRALAFTVFGKPEPKGSTRAFVPKGWTRPIITSANPSLKDWEGTIRDELQRVMKVSDPVLLATIFDAPLMLSLVFHLPRPKSAPKRQTEPTKKPDLDKLVRAAVDALSTVLFRDDAQVVGTHSRKVYARTAAQLEILVQPLEA